ncbi:hypothetical protein [Pseudodesulfovibrio sp.]|uniref:hypothetical protein n=1 Tax=Pseudodesulfovibrio sp. TaxID=2035812 RepID=UPI002635CC1A|nr:hypothetical protein [Pseudodesulfovibrio sp.]MDD3313662.1 hypothetical protein [Pseudodesulfovibrio sp.]
MRRKTALPLLLAFLVALLASGCALGKKEWPEPQLREDNFSLKLAAAEKRDGCLLLDVMVAGAKERLYRVSIEYEAVGDAEGEGCIGCPFVPRNAKHITRDSAEFKLEGRRLSISLCGLDPYKTYRFRVTGQSELPTVPLVHTDVYITEN